MTFFVEDIVRTTPVMGLISSNYTLVPYIPFYLHVYCDFLNSFSIFQFKKPIDDNATQTVPLSNG